MRSDGGLDPEIRRQDRWAGPGFQRWNRSTGADVAVSLSGGERNHLFLNDRGRHFDDVSGVSGLDTPGDSRSFAVFDYDRDGWQDVALVNTNAPFLNLYRNQIGASAGARAGRIIALRLRGGNRSARPSRRFGNRDGYGAVVRVVAGDLEIVREHRCGEGFATQNSATLIVGIGDRESAERVEVRWPGRTTQVIRDIPAGTLLTAFEDPSTSPDGEAFARTTYRRAVAGPGRAPGRGDGVRLALGGAGSAPLVMYVTTATWCDACKASLPRLARLRESIPCADLAIFGVPVDPEDGREKLEAYVAAYRPAYEILLDLLPEQVASVTSLVTEKFLDEVLPSTIVTNGEGRVLATVAGLPTVSAVRKLLDGAP